MADTIRDKAGKEYVGMRPDDPHATSEDPKCHCGAHQHDHIAGTGASTIEGSTCKKFDADLASVTHVIKRNKDGVSELHPKGADDDAKGKTPAPGAKVPVAQ